MSALMYERIKTGAGTVEISIAACDYPWAPASSVEYKAVYRTTGGTELIRTLRAPLSWGTPPIPYKEIRARMLRELAADVFKEVA